MPPKPRNILGQPSWTLSSDSVDAAVSELGGHIAPVSFRLGKKTVTPFSVAPWWKEKHEVPSILKVLRGDFFCMPFGGGSLGSEKHEVHGDSAGLKWSFSGKEKTARGVVLSVDLSTVARKGHIRKDVELRNGESVVYQRHVISKMSGRMPLGHHAMLKFESPGLISTSPIRYGQVYPFEFESPAQGGYTSLKQGAVFSSLAEVPMANGGTADLSRYAAREGFEDLVMVCAEEGLPFAWTAAVFPQERWAWISFRDPNVIASTVLWHSNGGRHYAPWSGRHRGVLGLEDVTAYFHAGLKPSVEPNPVSKLGIPTSIELSPKKPTVVNYIMAVAALPAGFDHVADVGPAGTGMVELRSRNGKKAKLKVDLEFLGEA